MDTFSDEYLVEVSHIASMLYSNGGTNIIEKIASIIEQTKRNNGRIFFLGIGGSAGNASHAVNDFRKIVDVEAYSPTENVSELTARINDSKEGWEFFFSDWLVGSNLNKNDLLFVLSVSGGSVENGTSLNLIHAVSYAKNNGNKIVGIIGNKHSFINTIADAILIIPEVNKYHVTPHAEEFQSVILHLLASHPKLKENKTKWEEKL